MRDLHPAVGKNRRKDRQQSRAQDTESHDRYDSDHSGNRGVYLQSVFLKTAKNKRPLWNQIHSGHFTYITR